VRELRLLLRLQGHSGTLVKTVFKEGALLEKTKQLIAVAVAHVTQCPIA
jgi:alkylhydroperoxidase/carboxymuconolactone decarboxylase family protein YurZ